MNIFDPLISGSLSVSGSGEISGDLTVLGTIRGTISGTTDNALTASEAPKYTLTSSFHTFTSSYTTGSFTGSFGGDGSGLYNIPSSGITGLNLSQIGQGSSTASISSTDGLRVNTNTEITGALTVTGQISGSLKGDGSNIYNIPASGVTGLNLTRIADGNATASISSSNGLRINSNTEITGALNLNEVELGGNNIVDMTLTDGGGKYYINGVKNPRLSFIKGFKYRFYYNNNNTHPLLFSLTSDGEHNGGTLYTTGVTTNADPFYVQVEVTDATATTLYYWCDHHVGMGNAISVYSDFLHGQSTINLINVDTEMYATTGSNNFTNIQRTSGSLVVTGSVDVTGSINLFGVANISGSIMLNGQAIGTGKLDETTFNSYTSSNDGRVSSIETSTGSLNSFTSSINTTIKTKLNDEGVISGSIQVQITGTTGYSTFSSSVSASVSELSSSVATTTSGLSSSVATTTSGLTLSISSISSSVATTTSGLSSSIGSLSSSVATTTSGLSSTNDTQNNRLGSIETSTSSLNTFTSSIDTTIKNKLNTESVVSGSSQILITGTTGYSTFSSSISTSIGALSSSVDTEINGLSSSIATTTNGLSSSIALTTSGLTSTITSLSSSVATTTNGLSSSIGSLSSSVSTTNLNQNNRLDSIEGKTGSYATTSSNIFQGNQTITGSLYISQDLIVGGSSSIQNISSSVLNIGDNIITVNAVNPSVRFGGLAVIDSGSSPQVSGSMLFDSVNNQWLFVHQDQSSVTSSVLLMGPETYNNLGGEVYLTLNRIPKGTGIEHLNDSNITDTGTKVSINSNTEVTGTLRVTGNITSPTITAIETSTSSLNTFTSSLLTAIELTGSNLTVRGDFLVKGTTTNVNTATLDVDNNLINLNGSGATFAGLRVKDTTAPSQISGSLLWDSTNDYWVAGQLGSEQRLVRATEFNTAVTRIGNVETSTGSLNSFTSSINTTIKSKLNIDDVISGSVQVNHNTTTNYDANQHVDHTAVSISAGSGLSGGGTIASTRTLTLDTGSVHFLDGVKKELNTEGVISGSSQVLSGSGIWSGSAQLPSGVVSGSAQVISLLPTGTVSGSAQLTSTFVQKTGDTMTGQLIVGSTGTGNSPTLRINNSTATSFNHSIEAFSSNMTAGQTNLIVVGKTGTTKNAGYVGYNFSSAGSNDNYVSLGHWGADNLLRVYGDGTVYMGTVTTGVWNGTAIANAYLANSSFHIGTTSISLGRASASQTLSGVSIDGNSATVTNGVYTNTTQTITGEKTFQQQSDGIAVLLDSTSAAHATRFRYRKNGVDYWSLDARGSGENDALNLYRYYSGNWYQAVSWNHSNGNATFAGTLSASNLSGTNTGDETKARINALAITTVGTIDSGVWNGSSIGTAYTAAKVTAVNAGTGVGVDTTTGSVTVSIGQSVATSAVPTFKALVLTSDTDSRVLKLRELGATSGNIIQFQDSAGNNKWEVVGRSNTDATPFYIYKNDGTNTGYIFSISGSGIPNFHTALTIGGSTAKSFSNSSYSTTFSSVTSVTVTHSLGTKDVAVFVYDSSDNMFWPSSIVTTSTSVVTITFSSSRSGRVVVVR
jgi:trimeric autotransporter adhesin